MTIHSAGATRTSGGDKRDMYQPKHRDVLDAGFFNNIQLAGTASVLLRQDREVNGLFIEEGPSGFASVMALFDGK